MKATNMLFKANSGVNPMRLILGLPGCNNKQEYERTFDEAFDFDAEPIVIVRKCEPKVWINDDVCFILDNMVCGCHDDWPDGLDAWWRDVESKDRSVGETFTFRDEDLDLVVTATIDGTPMTNLRHLEESEI